MALTQFPQGYRILIFDRSNTLQGVFTSARSFDFKDLVNGGSADASFVLNGSLTSSPTVANVTGTQYSEHQVTGSVAFPLPISFGWRVQFYLPDSVHPWYDGRISGFTPTQTDNEDDEYITVICEGWLNHLDDSIVSETLSPGLQPNGQDNGDLNADTYLQHLLSTYMDTDVFDVFYINPSAGGIPIGLSALQFDGEGLGQCIDDIVKQLQDNTGNTYEWWVRGFVENGDIGLGVVIQGNANPNAVPYATWPYRIAPTGSPTTKLPYHEIGTSGNYDYPFDVYDEKDVLLVQEEIQNTTQGLFNMIALYGGRDPTTQVQWYQPFQDSISISLFGLRQKKLTNNNLLSAESMTNYGAAQLLMNGYPQPQATYNALQPSDARRGGVWVQLIEPGIGQIASQMLRQMRIVSVETVLDEDTEYIYQRVTAAAPRPFIDKAYYGGLQQSGNLVAVGIARGASLGRYYYVAKGGDWVGSSTVDDVLTVSITACYAYFGTDVEGYVSANTALPLVDAVSGATGDGAYEVAFVNGADPTGTSASGTTTGSLANTPVATTVGSISGGSQEQVVTISGTAGTSFQLGVPILIGTGTSQEEVTVLDNSATTITGIFSKNHASGTTIYELVTQTVTVTLTTYPADNGTPFPPGAAFVIGSGSSQEICVVQSSTGKAGTSAPYTTTVTAYFLLPHSSGAAISQQGGTLYPNLPAPTLPDTGTLVVTKVSGLASTNGTVGRIPQNINVQRLWQFVVINGQIYGATDLRVVAIPPKSAPSTATFYLDANAYNSTFEVEYFPASKTIQLTGSVTLVAGENLGDGSWINQAKIYLYQDLENPQQIEVASIPLSGVFPVEALKFTAMLPYNDQSDPDLPTVFIYYLYVVLVALDGSFVESTYEFYNTPFPNAGIITVGDPANPAGGYYPQSNFPYNRNGVRTNGASPDTAPYCNFLTGTESVSSVQTDSLEALSDVSISSPGTGEVVGWSGTAWTAQTIRFNFNQASASSTWTINHNLGFYPSVVVVDSSGNVCIGAVTYTDVNNLTITFSSAFSGEAYLN